MSITMMCIRSRYNELVQVSLYQSLFTSANLALRLLVIALASNATDMKLGTLMQTLRAPGMTLNQIMQILRAHVN